MKRMLLSFAHPDDESFSVAGTVAKYAADGWEVQLLCATNGEAGLTGGKEWATGEALGAVRQSELECAAREIGIRSVAFLGYKDGGLKALPPGELEEAIYKKLHEFLPDIVVTFDTTGISNHPDHIKTCFATTFAFQKYARGLEELVTNPELYKGRGARFHQEEATRSFGDVGSAVSTEPKLYYTVMPESVAVYLKKEKVIPEESFERPFEGTPDKYVTTAIDISKFKLEKAKALACHETQSKDTDPFLSFAGNPLADSEYFLLRMQGVHEVFMGKTDRVADTL